MKQWNSISIAKFVVVEMIILAMLSIAIGILDKALSGPQCVYIAFTVDMLLIVAAARSPRW